MASGSITVKSPTSTVATYIGWSSSSNGSAANSSSVSATVYFRKTNGYTTKGTFAGSLTINGSSKSISRYGTWASSYIAIGSHSTTVAHNADGKKSITISTTYSNSGTNQAGTYTGSGTAVLDTIPRASSISSPASWTAGDDLTVSISRSASSFTHTVSLTIGSTVIETASGVATSVTFSGSEFQKKVFEALNKAASQTATVTVTTYSGSTSIGSKSVTGTVTAPLASTFTCTGEVEIEKDQVIDISRTDSRLTHSLKYSFRGKEGYLMGSSGGGVSEEMHVWNIGSDFYNLITDSVQDTCVLTLTSWYKPATRTVTNSDGTQSVIEYDPIQVRTPVEKSFIIKVVNSEPEFTSFSHSDINTVTRALTGSDGIAVRDNSDIRATISGAQKAQPKNGAQIVRYDMKIGNETVSSVNNDGDIVMTLPRVAGDKIFVTAYDSRGLSRTAEHSLILKKYEPVSIVNLEARRANGVDERTTLTADVYIWDQSFGSIINEIASCGYGYVNTASGGEEIIEGSTLIDKTDFVKDEESGLYHLEKVITGDTENGFALSNSYDIELRVSDKLGETKAAASINSGYPGIYMRRMKGESDEISYQVGINCVPDSRAGSGLYVSGSTISFNGRDLSGGVSIGSVMGWITDTPPEGWLLLDGSAVSRLDYSGLFSVIGTVYGEGDGETTFNLPDLRGRVPVGRSSEADLDKLGNTGGEKTHKLTAAEMPSHTHTVSGTAASGGAHTHLMAGIATRKAGTWNGCVASAGCSDTAWTSARSGGAHTHTVSGSAAAAGSGGAHNNMQPYLVLNYIIKAY